MSESSEITGPLIEALNQTGGYALRMNAGRVPIGRRWVYLHEEGTADIQFFPRLNLLNGVVKVVWIETKDPLGRTKKGRAEKQAEFRAKVEALGHRYILATSVQQGLDEALK